MTQINVYLNFQGNCREAMSFYKECLGGELFIQTVGGSPMEAQCPPGMTDKVLHSSVQKDSIVIMASDMTWPGYTKGNDISLSLNCSSDEEINTFYTKLSAGGTIDHALTDAFWGATFGVITDKFGIRWMFNYEKNKN